MRVAVIGAGGVGGFLGALLCRAGHAVTLLARGAHGAALRERGLTLESKQFGTFTVRPRVVDDPGHLGSNDLVIVAVKLPELAEVAPAAAAALAPDGVVVPIQNGIDAPDVVAAAAGPPRTLIGSIAIEAAVASPGTIAHLVATHQLTLAEAAGPPTPRLEHLAAALRAAGITVKLAADGRLALWQKAAFLIPFATLTAAAQTSFGEIWATPLLKAAWTDVREEALAVAAAAGYDARRAVDAMEATLTGMLPATAAFTSSMNRDFSSGRRGEVDWLTGRLVQLGRRHGVPVAAHEALYAVLDLRARRF